jgi:hypothetical protein
MSKFKVGDTVECIRGTISRLTRGNTYVVLNYDDVYVRIVDNLGEEGGWTEGRFELLHTPSKLTGMTQFFKDREISYE